MDDLAVPEVKGVEEAINAAGAEAKYPRPYSLNFNPIQMAWSKVKALPRAEAPPTMRRLVPAVGKADPNDDRFESPGNFFNAGYASRAATRPL